jgi:tetratricopeptide (TPR) repeat protein
LNSYYEVSPPASAADPRLLIGLGVLAALLGATAWSIWRAQRLALALLWVLMGIRPVLQFVPLKGFVMAERYLLLPSFGFALAAGLAGEAAWRRARTRPLRAATAGGAALVACAGLAIIMGRVPDWVEKLAFYRAMVRTAPDSAFAQNNLGQLLVAEGELGEGVRHLEAAIAIRPDMAYAHAGLGMARWKQGDLRGATASLERAARLLPGDPRILADLAAAYELQGEARAALAVLHRLEGLRPAAPEVARRLSAVYRQLGNPERAAAYAARAEEAPAGGASDAGDPSRPALPSHGSSP